MNEETQQTEADMLREYRKDLEAALEAFKPNVIGKHFSLIQAQAAFIVYGALLVEFGQDGQCLATLVDIAKKFKVTTAPLSDYN